MQSAHLIGQGDNQTVCDRAALSAFDPHVQGFPGGLYSIDALVLQLYDHGCICDIVDCGGQSSALL